MVRRFAVEGARVIVHGPPEMEATARRMAQELKVHWLIGDLADPETPAALIAGAVEQWGGLDALVNNAASTARSNLETTTAAFFDRMIAINVRAPLLLIQAALPHFRARGGGRVLNIGSINAHCGERNLLAYSISKGGLQTLTRNLADAYARENIRVNQLNLGWTLTAAEIETKKRDGLSEDWYEHVPPVYAPSGRLLSPDDIAWAAVYLMSDESPLLNGSVIDFEQYPVIGRNPHREE